MKSTEAVNKYREKQKEQGLAEIRGLYVKKEDHAAIKRLVKNFIEIERAEKDEQSSGLARGNLDG